MFASIDVIFAVVLNRSKIGAILVGVPSIISVCEIYVGTL